jgi:hypothetical protein
MEICCSKFTTNYPWRHIKLPHAYIINNQYIIIFLWYWGPSFIMVYCDQPYTIWNTGQHSTLYGSRRARYSRRRARCRIITISSCLAICGNITVSNEYLQCLTDCELLRISKTDADRTARTSFTQKEYTIKLFQQVQEEYRERIDDLANLTAEQLRDSSHRQPDRAPPDRPCAAP